MGEQRRRQQTITQQPDPVAMGVRLEPVQLVGVRTTEPCPHCKREIRTLDQRAAQALQNGQDVPAHCGCGQPVVLRLSLILAPGEVAMMPSQGPHER